MMRTANGGGNSDIRSSNCQHAVLCQRRLQRNHNKSQRLNTPVKSDNDHTQQRYTVSCCLKGNFTYKSDELTQKQVAMAQLLSVPRMKLDRMYLQMTLMRRLEVWSERFVRRWWSKKEKQDDVVLGQVTAYPEWYMCWSGSLPKVID